MLLTVTELKRYIDTAESNDVLEVQLAAIEMLIRSYTNNNFQKRGFRAKANISGGVFNFNAPPPFAEGGTVEVSESELNDGIYTVRTIAGNSFSVNEPITAENDVLVTAVHYSPDVIIGAVNLMKWELNNRDKVGVASETISRHSVTYFSMDGDNTEMGFPKSLMGFLKPYMRARFGKGVRL